MNTEIKEIESAVHCLKEIKPMFSLEHRAEKLQVLIELAEQYIKASEVLPEELKIDENDTESGMSATIAHNDCLMGCRLVLIKKCEGLMKVIDNIKIFNPCYGESAGEPEFIYLLGIMEAKTIAQETREFILK